MAIATEESTPPATLSSAQIITPLRSVLFFIHQMRTSPRLGGAEAMEWAILEQEFETRTQEALA